jgi:hypothetical protein
MTIVSPSCFLTEDSLLQDPVGEESEETLNRTLTCERSKTAPSTSGKGRKEKRQRREVTLSADKRSPAIKPGPCASTKKKKRGKKEDLAERVSRSRTSQVIRSGIEMKRGKMSKRRLLLRKRYYSLKRLGHKK